MSRIVTGVLLLALLLGAVWVVVPFRSSWWQENEGTPAQDPQSLPEQFSQVYTLEAGRVVKRIQEPALIAGRSEFLARHEINLHADLAASFRWSDDGLELQGLDYGSRRRPRTLARVLTNSLALPSYMVVYDNDLGAIELPGDWIIRKDASVGLMLKDLEGILESATGQPIHFIKRHVERSTIRVAGAYDATRVERQGGELSIYDTQKGSAPKAGGRGTIDDMLRWLGNLFDAALVNDSTGTEDASISWQSYTEKESYSVAEIERILANLSHQTGLTFECTQRETEVWMAMRRIRQALDGR